MTPEVARRMNRLNESFYRDNARSFDQTRQGAWPGWEHCLGPAMNVLSQDGGARILDVASGNLRFARYLAERLPGARVSYHGIDSCPELARDVRLPEGWEVTLQELDVVDALLGEGPDEGLGARLKGGAADLVACFGFFHHVPTIEARRRLLQELLSYTRAGGLCCVSLWRPMSDRRIARVLAQRACCSGLRSAEAAKRLVAAKAAPRSTP